MKEEKLSADFDSNIKVMDSILRVDESFDIIKRTMTMNGCPASKWM